MFDFQAASNCNAWPFQEARALYDYIGKKTPDKGYVLFETGYGPSGFPHIGTFGEVVRTIMVKDAFNKMYPDIPTRLYCVSDDMDGMRKVPDVIPNPENFKQYIGLPLTKVPDPFGTHESYGHHMNYRLRTFLDTFGFKYEFLSATDCYVNGTFNEMLHNVIDSYAKIMDIMLPTLGEERQQTYSPFLPVDPESGEVLQVSVTNVDKQNYTITYQNKSGKTITSEVTNGKTKLQWKPDFGMRWAAFDVDFEIYGKDHLVNGPIYTKICRAIGGKGPYQTFYELFLDEKGQKISKTKGNGITIDEWLKYATAESLAYFMYLSPKKAKRLYFDVIPKCVDEYLHYLRSYHATEEVVKRYENPVYHIHQGHPPKINFSISYSLLINLVSACGSEDEGVIRGYIKNSEPNLDEDESGILDALIQRAINYYHDFIKPNKKYREATEKEKSAMSALANALEAFDDSATQDELQNKVYEIGKEFEIDLKAWFKGLYEVLLGAEQGPRFGSFIKLYGVQKTIELLRSKC
ncbi:MAG: lysine--tRNA ligase [Alphaproteobacteria bacterium]